MIPARITSSFLNMLLISLLLLFSQIVSSTPLKVHLVSSQIPHFCISSQDKFKLTDLLSFLLAGTGKTAVAIRILQHWARLAMAQTKYGESPKPILATSDSNIAVDNLVEGK